MLIERKSDKRDEWTIVSLQGALDFNQSVSVLKLLLENVAHGCVRVDLSAVTHIDSSGIACIIETYRTAANNGLRFELSGANQKVMRMLMLFRLDTVLSINQTPGRAPDCPVPTADRYTQASRHIALDYRSVCASGSLS